MVAVSEKVLLMVPFGPVTEQLVTPDALQESVVLLPFCTRVGEAVMYAVGVPQLLAFTWRGPVLHVPILPSAAYTVTVHVSVPLSPLRNWNPMKFGIVLALVNHPEFVRKPVHE